MELRISNEQRRLWLYILGIPVLGLTLLAGLWPIHALQNGVRWAEDGKGIEFRRYGIAVSSPAPMTLSSQKEFTIELYLRPGRPSESASIISFYQSSKYSAIREQINDLQLCLHNCERGPGTSFFIDDLFDGGADRYIGIVTDSQGTTVYLNGTKVKSTGSFRFAGDSPETQLVLGTSPDSPDAWEGRFFKLRIYGRALSDDESAAHYAAREFPGNSNSKDPDLLTEYLFDEHDAEMVRDRGIAHRDLRIPSTYALLSPRIFETPVHAFHMSWSYVEDVSVNLAGFGPLGFVIWGYLSSFRRDSAGLVVLCILLCAAVSVAIESAQVFLPTRSSDLTDVIMNTLGGALGVVLARRVFCECSPDRLVAEG